MRKFFTSRHYLLALIFLLAAALRFYRLADQPVSLNWDEVSHGYNAYSLLKTAADEWGIKLPLIFRAYGDYKLPLYIYLTVVPVAVFGLNAFAVRFVSALAGSLAVPGIYLLTNLLFPHKSLFINHKSKTFSSNSFFSSINLGHISALLLALTPWHFFISRPALEANLSLTLIIFGAYFLLSLNSRPRYLLPASLLLGLSLHTYNTARIFVPLLVLVFLFVNRRTVLPFVRRHPRLTAVSAALFAASLLLVVYQTLSGTGLARYQKLAILSPDAVYQIGQRRLQSPLPPPLPRLVHNQPVYFVTTAARNYLNFFTPAFLYQTSGAQTQFAIPGANLLGLPLTILFLIGLAFSLLKRRPAHLFIILWLLISPLAASLTAAPPQALRPNPLLPVIVIFAALGLSALISLLRTLPARILLVIGLLSFQAFSFSHYWRLYFGHYTKEYFSSWQYGYDQAVDYVNSHRSEYQRLIFTKKYGEPHEFYAFFTKLDPRIIQSSDHTIKFFQSDWYWVDRIDNVYFVNDWDLEGAKGEVVLESGQSVPLSGSLIVAAPGSLPAAFIPKKVIDDPSGGIAFVIGEVR